MALKLPAISFLGLKGTAAWVALAGAGVGGVAVAQAVLPAIAPGRGGDSRTSSREAPTAELLASLTKAVAESSGRVATSALGPGASLGAAGIGLAGQVSGALERFAEAQTRAIADTQAELIRSQTAQTQGVLRFVTETVHDALARVPSAAPAAAPNGQVVAVTPAPSGTAAAPVRIEPTPPPAVNVTPVRIERTGAESVVAHNVPGARDPVPFDAGALANAPWLARALAGETVARDEVRAA